MLGIWDLHMEVGNPRCAVDAGGRAREFRVYCATQAEAANAARTKSLKGFFKSHTKRCGEYHLLPSTVIAYDGLYALLILPLR